jgi:hypothetical protein
MAAANGANKDPFYGAAPHIFTPVDKSEYELLNLPLGTRRKLRVVTLGESRFPFCFLSWLLNSR